MLKKKHYRNVFLGGGVGSRSGVASASKFGLGETAAENIFNRLYYVL